jgi:hypothetical protein
MSDLDTPGGTRSPDRAAAAVPALRRDCASVAREQNDRLRRRCGRKANLLSCRCVLCEGENRFPILVSPADAPLLNTAYDGNGGALASGADPRWEVGRGDASGPASVRAWDPAQVVTAPPSSWVVSPYRNANWISNAENTGDDLYFRIRFNLGSGVDPAVFAVEMKFYADNRVWEIYVNGTAQSTQPSGAGVLPQFPDPPDVQTEGFVEGREVRIRLDNHWRPCENEIVVHVKSPGGETGLLAQNAVQVAGEASGCDCHCECTEVELPAVRPCITVSWGDTECDCMETNDFEVLCITVCNCYSNVTFGNLSIGHVQVTDMAGNAVPPLPDGTPSVQVVPTGPLCFGDIGPCVDRERPTCVSRELVLYTRGAVGRQYRLVFNGICFSVCHTYQQEQCFGFKLCQD